MRAPAPRKSSSPPRPPALPEALAAAFRYAEDVVAGKIVAGEMTRLACQRHLDDMEKGGERGLYFDADAADRVLRFFPTVLRHSKGEWAGQPVLLQPWQAWKVASLFGWKWRATRLRRFKRAYTTVGRKNGKSTEASGIGLFMLTSDGEAGARVHSYATKQDQARIVFDEAGAMVRKSPGLSQRVKVHGKAISFLAQEAQFTALSSEEHTLDGLNPHLAIGDELHAHRTRAVYDVIDSAFGSRQQPLHLIITTRGSNRAGICGELDDYTAHVLRGNVHDDSWFGAIWACDEEDRWDNEEVWPKANPNLGVSVKLADLRDLAKKARAMPSAQNEFKRKRCNLWTESQERWIDYEVWKAGDVEVDDEELIGRPSWWGLDLSGSRDLTALVGAFDMGEGRVALRCRFWLPADDLAEREKQDRVPYFLWKQQGWLETTPGASIDRRWIASALAEELSRPEVRGLAYDRWRIKDLFAELDAIGFRSQIVRPDADGKIDVKRGGGVPLVEAGQGYRDMSPAVDEFEVLLAARNIAHGGNPVLTMCASNAVLDRDPAGNRKWAKQKATGRIDGVVAASMAVMLRKRLTAGPKTSVYRERGLMVL